MPRIRMLLAGGIAITILSLPIVHAQQAPEAAPDLSTEDDCAVLPGGEAPDPQARGDGKVGSDTDDTSLSETLDRCGSVLVPPAVGSDAFVTPPPNEGTTPVIPPSTVPEAQ